MNPKSIILSIILVGIAIGGGVWLFTDDEVKQKTEITPDISADEAEHDPIPEISETGPYPEATVDIKEFEFGIAGVKEVKSHEFTIKNDGEVPLKLARGKTTCQCTLSELDQMEILPGKSSKVKLIWEAKAPTKVFRHTAKILTNDPNNKEIRFVVSGIIESILLSEPYEEWNLGMIPENKESYFTGKIFSRITDQIEFVDSKSSNENITSKLTPLTKEELSDLKALAGYSVKIKTSPNITVGVIKEDLKIKMKLKDSDSVIRISLKANRFGPIRVISTVKGRMRWYPQDYLLNMGTFPASDGKSHTMPMLVLGMKEDFKVTEVKSDLDFVNISINKVALEKDDFAPTIKDSKSKKDKIESLSNFDKILEDTLEPAKEEKIAEKTEKKEEVKKEKKDKKTNLQRYNITFEVKPGNLPISKVLENSVKIRVKTNHPKMKEMIFQIGFISI